MFDFGECFVDYFLVDSASLQRVGQFACGMLVELRFVAAQPFDWLELDPNQPEIRRGLAELGPG